MRAIARFCEHEQASTRLNFASKSSKGKILRAVEKLYDHSIPLDSIEQDRYGRLTVASLRFDVRWLDDRFLKVHWPPLHILKSCARAEELRGRFATEGKTNPFYNSAETRVIMITFWLVIQILSSLLRLLRVTLEHCQPLKLNVNNLQTKLILINVFTKSLDYNELVWRKTRVAYLRIERPVQAL